MAFTDPIGDMITRIRNAQMRKKDQVSVPFSCLKKRVLDVLLDEGYIQDYKETGETVSEKKLVVDLKYSRSRPVIRSITRVSKPSLHVYRSASDRSLVENGLGNSILSTSRGVMSDTKARALGIGGKILINVS